MIKMRTLAVRSIRSNPTRFVATVLGVPVSTTHTITGAIVGVGAVNRPGSVRWGIAVRILWAWVFTIPASAGMAVATYYVLRLFGM